MRTTVISFGSILFLAGASSATAQTQKPAAPAPAAAPAAAPAPAAKPAAPAGGNVATTPGGPATKPGAPPAAAPAAPAAPAAAGTAAPAAAAPPAMPKPSKELEAFMKGFEGTWKCDTKFAPGAMGPGSPEVAAKTTVKFKKELNGFVYRGDYEVKKQKGVDMPMKGFFYLGYDPGSDQLLVNGVDSLGGMSFGTGKISGDTATYTTDGYVMGMKVKSRETFGKKGDKEAFHRFEMDMGKGFVPMGEDTCKK